MSLGACTDDDEYYGECIGDEPGWGGSVPDCGDSGNYLEICYTEYIDVGFGGYGGYGGFAICNPELSERTQACR